MGMCDIGVNVTWNRCRPAHVALYTRGVVAFLRVGVVGVAAAVAPPIDAVVAVNLVDPFCSEYFNGEFRINSSKSSAMSSILCGGVALVDNEPLIFVEWSLAFGAMRKFRSKSSGLRGCCWFMLKDNDRANVLLNCGQMPGDCGLFGMRTSLLCKFVSIVITLSMEMYGNSFIGFDSIHSFWSAQNNSAVSCLVISVRSVSYFVDFCWFDFFSLWLSVSRPWRLGSC